MNWERFRRRPARRYLEAGFIAFVAAPRLMQMRRLLDRGGFAEAKQTAERLSRRCQYLHVGPVGTAVIVHRVASMSPRRLNCLPRALTLWSLTRAAGYATELKIGVAPRTSDGKRIEAHAWVELDGRALGESAARYVTMPVDARRSAEPVGSERTIAMLQPEVIG